MCTSLTLRDAEGITHVGRTMELTTEKPWQLMYLPSGTALKSLAQGGESGLSFTTSLPVLGIGTALRNGLNDWFVQGCNPAGLVGSVQAFNDATSPKFRTLDDQVLAATDLLSWALGTCTDVATLRTALKSQQVWVPGLPHPDDPPAAYHYPFFDRAGDGLVVQFYDDRMHVHDNPVGAVTNGPEFDWHLKNLQNYTFVSNSDDNERKYGGFMARSQDNGIATSGLPAANTSQGRFVKAAFYSTHASAPSAGADPLIQLGHMLNNFDRPQGLTVDRARTQGDGGVLANPSSEWTLWSTLHDLTSNRMLVRTDDQLNWMEFRHDAFGEVMSPRSVPLSQVCESADPEAMLIGI